MGQSRILTQGNVLVIGEALGQVMEGIIMVQMVQVLYQEHPKTINMNKQLQTKLEFSPGLILEGSFEDFLHMAQDALMKAMKSAANATPSFFV